MMLDIKSTLLYVNLSYYFMMSGGFLLVLSVGFFYLINVDFIVMNPIFIFKVTYLNWFQKLSEFSSINMIGVYLYTLYSFFFLMASLVLLVAMLGSIVLTVNSSFSSSRQFLYKQVNITPKQAMFLSKIKA